MKGGTIPPDSDGANQSGRVDGADRYEKIASVDAKVVLDAALRMADEPHLSGPTIKDLAAGAAAKWFFESRGDARVATDPGAALAYVNACVEHSKIDRYRRNRVRRKKEERVIAEITGIDRSWADPSAVLANKEMIADIRNALQQLSPNERRALALRYFEDVDRDTIAGLLNMSVRSVNRLLTTAYSKLAESLAAYGPSAPREGQS